MTQQDRSPLRLVAIIAAYNEEDIIGPALAHLIEQGASVYLLDDGSTDRTVAVAQVFKEFTQDESSMARHVCQSCASKSRRLIGPLRVLWRWNGGT
jgi:hypothetical protein